VRTLLEEFKIEKHSRPDRRNIKKITGNKNHGCRMDHEDSKNQQDEKAGPGILWFAQNKEEVENGGDDGSVDKLGCVIIWIENVHVAQYEAENNGADNRYDCVQYELHRL